MPASQLASPQASPSAGASRLGGLTSPVQCTFYLRHMRTSRPPASQNAAFRCDCVRRSRSAVAVNLRAWTRRRGSQGKDQKPRSRSVRGLRLRYTRANAGKRAIAEKGGVLLPSSRRARQTQGMGELCDGPCQCTHVFIPLRPPDKQTTRGASLSVLGDESIRSFLFLSPCFVLFVALAFSASLHSDGDHTHLLLATSQQNSTQASSRPSSSGRTNSRGTRGAFSESGRRKSEVGDGGDDEIW